MDCPSQLTGALGRWTSYLIAVAALVALGGHVLLTLVYLSPPNIAQEHIGAVAQSYIKPLFSQRWHLFSPNPGVSTRKLGVRCESDDAWSEWFDPTEDLIAQHNANRFSGVGKLLYVYRAVGDDLRREIAKQNVACLKHRTALAAQADPADVPQAQPQPGAASTAELGEQSTPCSAEALMDDVVETHEFDLAVRYSEHVCQGYADEASVELTGVQFKLLEFFPIKYGDREAAEASGRRWDKVREIVFPIIIVGG